MRRSAVLSLTALTLGGLAFGVVPTTPLGDVIATPVACEEGDVTPDGRVFPEPMASATFLSFAEFECGMERLVAEHPERLRMDVMLEEGDGVAGALYDVVMTDMDVPAEQKERLLVMSSIHGNEVGAREGAARQIEDMLTADAVTDIDDEPLDVDRLLREFEIHWVFPNPDGWISGEGTEEGDLFAAYARGEDDGKDLNRNFPVQGYFAYQSQDYFEEEGTAVRELLLDGRADELAGRSGGWDLGTDNHGQLTDSYLAAGLQIVGQFDFNKSERLATFADRIDDEMANWMSTAAFAELQLALQAQGQDVAGGYRWGTLYDILGYSASGSGIDYYNTPGEVEGVGFATELTASNLQGAKQYTFFGPLVQVWVDSIRAINNAMFKEALAQNDGEREFTFELDGDIAYVLDPARITHDDENGRGNEVDAQNPGGHVLQPYDVSKYDFFAELAPLADADVTPVLAEELAETDLSGFEAVIVTETEVLDRLASPADVAALRAYAESGGTLLLTDDALRLLPTLTDDGITPDAITVRDAYVGAVQEFVGDSELNANLRGIASQTYDTVPIGYGFPGQAPNWIVDQEAFEAAGGTTAGISKVVTFNALGQAQLEQSGSEATIYGELPLGEGRVRILGALLPDPTEEFYHPFGLQDYAVTYTGYTLLQNMVNAD